MSTDNDTAFVILWEYEVRPDSEAEFRATYGPEGEWAQLFARDPGYLGTQLLEQVDESGRYVTIDRWRDRASFERFERDNAAEYAALDARCEHWTAAERLIGQWRECAGPVVSSGFS